MLKGHAKFAQRVLSRSAFDISATMRRHQLKLADRQCRMSALSLSLQNAITMLVTALYAADSDHEITRAAGDVICRELRRKITGGHETDEDFQITTRLGGQIADHGWSELRDVTSGKILMPYHKN